MKILFVLLFTAVSFFITACSKGGGSGNGGNGNNNENPQTKEEALKKLSDEHRSNFNAWVLSVSKSCDASEAFGLSGDQKLNLKGIDASALIKKNNGSVVFTDDKSFAVLTDYRSYSGIGNSKVDTTVTMNDQSYSLSAEAKRAGSKCELFLYGQKVYETVIVESMSIGAYYVNDKVSSATSQNPLIKNIGDRGFAELEKHGIYNLLSDTLTPIKTAKTLVGQRLGFSEEESERLLQLSNYSSINSSIRIKNESTSIWSDNDYENLIASPQSLQKYFDGVEKVVPFEIRLKIPQFDFIESKNTADGGSLSLHLNVLITKKENGYKYDLKQLTYNGLVGFDKSESITCAADRFNALFVSYPVNSTIYPSVRFLFSACRTFYNDIEDYAYENGFLKEHIADVFAHVVPANNYKYSGWDYVLNHFAKLAMEQNKSIQAELDPLKKTKIILTVEQNLENLKTEILRSKNLAPIKENIYQMGLDWALSSINVSYSKVTQIIEAADNAADVFKVSTQRLISELSSQPQFNDDMLSFAKTISDTYKSEALRTLNLAKELNNDDFESDVFNNVIQKKITFEEIKDWNQRFITIKNEISKYPSLANVKPEVVRLSLNWLKSGEVTATEIGAIYSSLNNVSDPFIESTKQLLVDLKQSLGANKEALDFAKNISAEYKQLALSIRENSKVSDYESWGQNVFNTILQKKPSLAQMKQWNDLWVSTVAFVQREKTRTQGELSSFPEWNRKKVIEVAVNEIWSNQEFVAFEAIASVATGKSSCDRYKDMSSLAECAGLRLFSKNSKMFFDSNFANRYQSLATDFNNYIRVLSSFDRSMLKDSLLREFFGSFELIWSKCDNSVFAQKSSALRSHVNAIAQEKDQFKIWDLERQIKETTRNCQ